MTLSEEDYIKAIYHLGKGENHTVSTNEVAEKMETKPSSVTDMVKKLSEKGLVNYRPYKGVSLTGFGQKMALTLVRKHRLWEVFLVEKLDFSWDEVHEVAEQLEHIKSEKLIDRLDKHLGFPQVDPHGDPIPSKKGEFKKAIKKLLSEVPIGVNGICVGVKDSSAPFLKFLDKNNIALGDTIAVKDKEEFDGSLHIQIKNRDIHISQQIAANLYLKITE
ncbi:metal-dependent transcriptional regulator [Pseudozobellia thermophila]|uniref:Transcriptional regulator MntR n=1 Tax=Pseudozobellia thermophila TaxID=192903 RepID=A0A1M6C6U3_9FLAO|nr:metal-dependent transcriptional regulator [Pseudozobellia thermophila]SHI56777.1 iron (metal) dependent repressor, DtxR family [Pseudozobellia thermophila]